MKSSFFRSLSVISLLVCSAPSLAADPVVAIVNGKKFTYSEVMKGKALLPKQYQSLSEDRMFPLLLNQVIDTWLVDAAASTSDIAKKPETKEAISKATKDIIAQAYILDNVKGAVTDAAVKEKCNEVIKAFKPEKEVHLFHILVDAEDIAKSIIKALKGGTEFKKLAQTKSKDTTANKGGDLGFFRKGELPKELAEAAFSLKPGAYSETPIKTDFGWHILKVTESRDAKPPKCEDISNEIKSLLTQEAILKLLDGLRAKAKVELFDKDGKPLPEKEKNVDKSKETPPESSKKK